MVREIELSNGMVTFVDDEDYDRLSCHRWYAAEGRYGCFYAIRNDGGRSYQMQRDILDPNHGEPTSRKADHRDGVTLNNQRHNLRWSTDSQSNANRRLFKNNTSGYRGVYGPNEYGRYLAQLKINKKRYHLGYYGTAEEAARRYDFFARDLFGEFARLNLVSSELGAHG